MKWYFFFFSHYLQPSHVKCPFSDLVNYSVGASLQDISLKNQKRNGWFQFNLFCLH